MASGPDPHVGFIAGMEDALIERELASIAVLDGQFIFRERKPDGTFTVKPIAPATLRQAIAHLPFDSGWLPETVRRAGDTPNGPFAVSFFPAGVYRLPFVNTWATGHAKTLYWAVPLPALVFLGIQRSYYVWALKANVLQPDAQVYHAPLPNLDGQGRICFGGNRLPKATAQTLDKAWRVFLNAPFNDHQVDHKSARYPDDVRDQLKALARMKRKQYPLDDLVSANLPLERLVKSILEKP